MADKCGAKTRAGGKCKAPAMPNGRCRVHGGQSTGVPGNKNAVTHGIYSKSLSPDETKLFGSIEIGTLVEEIKITKLRLSRALEAEKKSQSEGNMEVEEETTEGDKVVSQRKRRKDYHSIIDRLTGRIESLERSQLEFNAINGTGQSATEFIAELISKLPN